jgi:DNA-binding transcriptional MerR regulator
MKTKLYGDTDLNSDAIKDMLESENCGVEEKEFVKAFSDEELETVETEYLEESKKLAILKRKLDEVSAPLKEQMKPLQKTLALNISRINAGGRR